MRLPFDAVLLALRVILTQFHDVLAPFDHALVPFDDVLVAQYWKLWTENVDCASKLDNEFEKYVDIWYQSFLAFTLTTMLKVS